MVFLDGAIARLAPDLDLLAEVAAISMLFAQRHGERIMTEIGIDAARMQVDLDSVKAGLGVDLSTERLTYRELQERRALIQKRMRAHVDERRR
jgi:ubiquinone biosynthesis protein